MKFASFVLGALVLGTPAWAHPHEWVDWGVGLVLDQHKPVEVVSATLELTWDEWYSALVVEDYPTLGKAPLSSADLASLDTTYGLGSPDRAVDLNLSYRGKPIKAKLVMLPPRYDGKQITFVYTLALGLKVDSPSELKVEIYDPTYYTDMGIRAKAGAYFVTPQGTPTTGGTFKFVQDFARAYYGGSVFPEEVAFSLKP